MWMRMPGRSTFKLLILLSGSIFVSETFILQVLPRLVNSVGWASAIVDASLLTLVTFPLLYFSLVSSNETVPIGVTGKYRTISDALRPND